MQAMIEKIEIYRKKRKDGCWIRSIPFKFPLPTKDGEIREFPLESLATLESVVTLSKGEVGKENIYVDFSLEDFDMSSYLEDPTYPQIREYVLEHTGLKVSSLYIAQIKKRCGLNVGECYNKPKSDNSRTYICPLEKKAIMDAFRYFGMI